MDCQVNDGVERKVKLLALTTDVTAQPITASPNDKSADSHSNDVDSSFAVDGDLQGYFETAQWTADGTTLLTSSSSHSVSGYIVPEDLLSADSPLTLSPQSHIQLPEPSNVLAGAPYFNLSEPWTNQLLVSSRDHPIQLFYLASTPSSASPASSYPFTKARSEDLLAATSLVWPNPGSHFIAGSRSMLAKFDISRTGSEPLLRIKTIPSERHLAKGGGVGMRGTVSTLSAQPPDQYGVSLIAAGTWTRWVGLYDLAQAGECVTTWSIASAAQEAKVASPSDLSDGIGGDGITQALWSPCGRYLLISERKSKGILVYDVRVTGKLLAWLSGRDAGGNQRIYSDVFPGQDASGGFEVWSGTTNGVVKVWEEVGTLEGNHKPAWSWPAHQSTVGSTCLHQSGTVVATCSGSWSFPDSEEDGVRGVRADSDGSDSSTKGLSWMRRQNKESSLKIWRIPTNDGDKELSHHEDRRDYRG